MKTMHAIASALVLSALTLSPAFGGMMEKERTAKFTGIGSHNASGTVAVAHGENGHTILKMTQIKVDRVPDGRVYLAKDGDYASAVELGSLTQFSGTVAFPIPASVNADSYNSVLIWCKRFDVGIGQAFFGKGMTDMHGSMMESEKAMVRTDTGMTK